MLGSCLVTADELEPMRSGIGDNQLMTVAIHPLVAIAIWALRVRETA